MRPNLSVVNSVVRALPRVLRDVRGATAVEYGLILGFVVVALIVGLTELGNSTSGMWNGVSTKVANAH